MIGLPNHTVSGVLFGYWCVQACKIWHAHPFERNESSRCRCLRRFFDANDSQKLVAAMQPFPPRLRAQHQVEVRVLSDVLLGENDVGFASETKSVISKSRGKPNNSPSAPGESSVVRSGHAVVSRATSPYPLIRAPQRHFEVCHGAVRARSSWPRRRVDNASSGGTPPWKTTQ